MDKVSSSKVHAYLPGATTATAATAISTIDTIGCERAHIFVLTGSHTTTSTVFTDIDVYEGTNTSPATLIAAASFGTATSTAAANLMPTGANIGLAGGVIEIDLDLKGRERYIGVKTTRGTTAAASATGGVLVILDPDQSADNTTTKRMVNYGINTNPQAVAHVVVPS